MFNKHGGWMAAGHPSYSNSSGRVLNQQMFTYLRAKELVDGTGLNSWAHDYHWNAQRMIVEQELVAR
jgi:hypothetical protein